MSNVIPQFDEGGITWGIQVNNWQDNIFQSTMGVTTKKDKVLIKLYLYIIFMSQYEMIITKQ